MSRLPANRPPRHVDVPGDRTGASHLAYEGSGHLREKKLWVKWQRAREKAGRLRDQGKSYYKTQGLADRLQYQLQDMSPYGWSMIWSYPGTRFAGLWQARKHRRTQARRSR